MEKLKILIVDDEEELVSALVERLNLRGFEAAGETAGEAALARLESSPCDVLLLDVKMPGLGGLEVIQRVKQRNPALQVVLLTGHGSAKSVEEGMALGAFDYLMKPVKIDDLARVLNAAGAGRGAGDPAIRPTVPGPAPGPTPAPPRAAPEEGTGAGYRVLLVDDEEEFTEALAERLDARGLSVSRAAGGGEALDLARQRSFDAIVLDVAMPGMDGLQTLEGLLEINPALQVILLTGRATLEQAAAAIRIGALDLLEKPADIQTLAAKIELAATRKWSMEEKAIEQKMADIIRKKGW